MGTTVTVDDLIKAYKDLDKMPKNQIICNSDFEEKYKEAVSEGLKQYDKIKYLEMWKKVKREFPFTNKM